VSIVDNSLQKLEQVRQTGTRHQLIAVACSINHAQRIRSLYKERGYEAAIIHSKQDSEEQEAVMRDLRNGVLDCIIQVQMLGEGFDHPKLSVAAIFRPFRSLAPYIQFVGRILRVIVHNDPTHPDNYGHIVTHVGLNLDEQLKNFKEFENDDQKFWEEVTGGEEPEAPREVTEGEARLKLHEDMVVNSEIVDRVFEEDFSTAEDKDILEDLEKKLEALGLDPTLAPKFLATSRSRAGGPKTSPAAQPFAIIPAKQWEEAKRRLNEEAKRTAKLLLNRTGLKPEGLDLPFKLKPGIGGKNNFIAAFQMVNEGIGKRVASGKKRQEWTSEEFASAMSLLPEVLNTLVREVKKLQSVRG
jgi:superfamily II DNA/RNA helicase